jgi:acetone carboxylase alpha subunit
VRRDQQACTTESSFADYDLYLNYLRGGPGFGDPLEREPKAIEGDLNGNYLLPRFAESVYGAVFEKDEQGRYVVDEARTAARRAEIRKERICARSPCASGWRRNGAILAKDASIQVRHMFASCFASSEPFRREFRSFWSLPESWTLDEREIVAENPSYGYGSLAREPLEALPDVTRIVLTEE